MQKRYRVSHRERTLHESFHQSLFLILISFPFYETTYAFNFISRSSIVFKNNYRYSRFSSSHYKKNHSMLSSKASSQKEKKKTSSPGTHHISPVNILNKLKPNHHLFFSHLNESSYSSLKNSLIGVGLPLIVVISLAIPQPEVGDLSVLTKAAYEVADDGIADISSELINRIENLPLIEKLPINDVTEAITSVVGGISSSIDELPLDRFNGQFISEVELISNRVIDAAVSTDPVDFFSIALGEGLAGLIGAVATFLVGSIIMNDDKNNNKASNLQKPVEIKGEGIAKVEDIAGDDDYYGDLEESAFNEDDFFLAPSRYNANVDYNERTWYSSAIPNKETERRDMVEGLITTAVADSDFFLTKSAAKNLFFAMGIAPALAELASVLVATVPYEFVKLTAKMRQLRQEEDRVMNALLLEKQMSQEFKNKDGASDPRIEGSKLETIVDNDKRVKSMANNLDLVDLFSDLLKWLEFGVLDSDYSGSLQWNGEVLSPGIESAVFGVIVAASSNLYADITYRYTTFGPEAKRMESRSRTYRGWIKKYLRAAVSTATLFGVYSAARFPIQTFLSELLSGGIEGCTGSKDFELCMETYLTTNPAMASKEAEIRSFLVALSSFIDRVRIDLDEGNVGWTELGRSLFVQLYSLLSNMF